MGTELHTHRFTFYPHGANTTDGGRYVCDCGATPIDPQYSGPVTFHEATRDITRAVAVLTQVYPDRLTPSEVAALFDAAHLARTIEAR